MGETANGFTRDNLARTDRQLSQPVARDHTPGVPLWVPWHSARRVRAPLALLDLTGRLRPGLSPWHAFAALFPAVTATVVPKARPAYPLIRSLEGRPRGLYSGAVLTCDAAGNLDAALVLCSVFQHEGECWLQAGAGAVRQSRPEREHEETCEKLSSVAGHLVRQRRGD